MASCVIASATEARGQIDRHWRTAIQVGYDDFAWLANDWRRRLFSGEGALRCAYHAFSVRAAD